MAPKKVKKEEAAMAVVPAEAATSVNLNAQHFQEIRDAYNLIMGTISSPASRSWHP